MPPPRTAGCEMRKRYKIIAMAFFLAVCAAAPSLNYFLILRRAEKSTPSDLYKVIHNQLDAFRAEDFTLAYSQASYGMHQKFSRDQFEEMIRRDYPDLTQAQRIEFGIVKYRDRRALIQVFFIGRDGTVLPCIYTLIYETGGWKIDGAVMLPRWQSGSDFEGLSA